MIGPLTSIRKYTPTMREQVMAGLRLLSNCLGSYMRLFLDRCAELEERMRQEDDR